MDLSNKIGIITTNFIIIINKIFNDDDKQFDINLLDIINEKNENFNISVKYSIDKINYINNIPNNTDFVVVLVGEKLQKEIANKNRLIIDKNINNDLHIFEFSEIKYNNEKVEYNLDIINDIIDTLPKWNYYDNQQITLNNWKKQILAVSNMYGHQMSYFKTDVVETNKTFQNNYVRDVVDIKKLMIMVPNNDLPKDTVVYSEWDYGAVDEIYFDIVDESFRHAFGDDKVPMQGDAIYFPLINKYFRVTSVQPKNSFMGYVGWWNVYLTKYEEDEQIGFSNAIENAMDGTIFEAEYKQMLESGLITADSILENTTNEKQEINEAYTNKLKDSSMYVDVKETENIRSYINKRLNIIKLRPSKETFPVTMYDLNSVERKHIAVVYDLENYNKNNKHTLIPTNNFNLSFNIATRKFSGTILDLLTEEESIYFSLTLSRSLDLKFNFAGDTETIITNLTELEYYQIIVNFDGSVLNIIINTLHNGVKTLIFNNNINIMKMLLTLKTINLYGGKYYINDLTLLIDDNKIMQDYCNPILKYN